MNRKKSLLEEFKPKTFDIAKEVKDHKDRPFSDVNCKGCQFRGSFYCWNQCSFNRWKKR